MAEEKEKLTEAQEQDTNVEAQEQESVEQEDEEDLFNPFADSNEESEEQGEGEEDSKEKKKESDEDTQEPVKDEKARARLDAIEVVDEYLEENPEYNDIKKELREFTAKAIERGHKNPVEFAVRNAKPPKYWVSIGEKRAREALESGRSTTLRGTSASAGTGNKSQDYASMPKSDFNAMVEQVKRNV